MGLYDEFKLKKKYKCPCGHKEEKTQCKAFGSFMEYYKPGEIIEEIEDKDFIQLEEIHCNNCNKITGYTYLTFAQGIYIGNYKTIKKANKEIKSFKKDNWILTYKKINKRVKKQKEKISNLHRKNQEKKNKLKNIEYYIEEYLKTKDITNLEKKEKFNFFNVFDFKDIDLKTDIEILKEIFSKL